ESLMSHRMARALPQSPLFPYTTLFRSNAATPLTERMTQGVPQANGTVAPEPTMDPKNVGDTILLMANMGLDANIQFVTVMAPKIARKSTRLNSSHVKISYAVFCLKKKK